MKKLVASIHAPGKLTVLAALLAGICAPAMAASDIVISQVYGGGGNASSHYKNDFVELFNRGTSAVTISNWSLQYTSAAGNSWGSNKTTIVGPFTLQPGQYLLVQEAANSPVSGDAALLPAAEVTGTVNMSGTAGKIALVNNNTNLSTSATPTDASIIDLVGYGSTANFSEGTVAPAPSNTNSIQRKLAGCTDSDNNGGDFAAGVALPRNGSTPLNACAGGPPVAAPIVVTCPASLPFLVGSGAFAALSATDTDSIVNGASITAGAVPGITLGALTPAGAAGGTASINLNVDASVAAGSYPVEITFTNADAQSKSCTVTVASATPKTIMQIQGSGATSPFNNTVQTTEGVITVKTSNGFYIQDPVGDNDTATSDAILVFGSTTNFLPGDLVRVTGTVTEFTPGGGDHSITEFKNVSAVTKISSNNTITPVNITAPAAGLAQYESMLVRVTNPLTVNDTSSLGGFGELTLSNGRREVPTNHYPAGSAGALAMAAANAANAIVLGDGGVNNPIPFIGDGSTVRVGDTVTDLVGVVDYGAIGGGQSGFKIQPVALTPPTFSRTNARLLAPIVPQGNVKVASANVLNFFTTFTDGTDVLGNTGQGCSLGASTSKGNCRGADSLAEFNRQLAKIVNELKAIDADVVGLMEIQNNGEKAVSYLVDSLNTAIGFPTYAYVPMPPATGTDAIRVAMIYKPATLSLVGPALSDGDAVNNRPPMAQTFKAGNGAKFSVIVNHLKSKSGCPAAKDSDAPGNLDSGDSQGCWNASRVQQAQRLASFFIPQVVSVSGDPDVLLIGDMNSHGFEDPINVLTGTGMVNELERFVRPNGIVYSYVFDGESGYLDHALATAALDPQMAGATEWHNNADEPEVIDYNFNLGTSTAAKPQDLYVNNAYRASDHDPVVVSLNLAPTFIDATGSFKITQSGLTMNRFTSKYTGTVSFTNTTGAAISGPVQFQLDGLPAGVTLDNKNGDHAGSPYLTLNATSIAPGATVTVTTTFSNPSKISIVYTPKLFTGTF